MYQVTLILSVHTVTPKGPHMPIMVAGNPNLQSLAVMHRGGSICLTQLDVVGVEQEVGQVEELRDQLPDVAHVVSGGRLPLFLHAVEHPLCDVKAALRAGGGTERESWRREEPDFAPVHAGKCLICCSKLSFEPSIALSAREIFAAI